MFGGPVKIGEELSDNNALKLGRSYLSAMLDRICPRVGVTNLLRDIYFFYSYPDAINQPKIQTYFINETVTVKSL